MSPDAPDSDQNLVFKLLRDSEVRDEILACLDFIGNSSEQDPRLLASLTLAGLPGWLEEQGFRAEPLIRFCLNAEALIAPGDASDSLSAIAGSLGPDATVAMLLEAVGDRTPIVHAGIIRAIAEAHDSLQQLGAVAGGLNRKGKIEVSAGVLGVVGLSALLVKVTRRNPNPQQDQRLPEMVADDVDLRADNRPALDVDLRGFIGDAELGTARMQQQALVAMIREEQEEMTREEQTASREGRRAEQMVENRVENDVAKVRDGDLPLERQDAQNAIAAAAANPRLVRGRLATIEEDALEDAASEEESSIDGWANERFGGFEESVERSVDTRVEHLAEDALIEGVRLVERRVERRGEAEAEEIAREDLDADILLGP